MAFTRFTGFTVDWLTKNTLISGQATNFKTWLNTRTADLSTWVTALLGELESTTDGDSGADNIGATAIAGVTGTTVQAQMESLATVATATITADWVGSSAPYTQDVTITGLTADHTPAISPVYSSTNSTAILEKIAWNCVGKIVTGTDKITITCFEEKPVTAIPIQIKGV